jgi:hypothetical protein
MTSGQIVGKMYTQKQLNVPLERLQRREDRDAVRVRGPVAHTPAGAACFQVLHFAVKSAYKLKNFIRL